MEEQLDKITKTLKELKSNQSKMIDSLNSQSEKLTTLTNNYKSLSVTVTKLLEDNNKLNEKLLNLEKKVSSFNDNKYTENDIVMEIIDRQSRLNNLILFNLPEQPINDNLNPIKPDHVSVKQILDVMDVKVNPVNISRLGAAKTDQSTRPRPIKVTFSNSHDVGLILRSQKKLSSNSSFKDLRFVSDRTRKQKEFMSALRTELNHRRDKGESDISIKYVKGIPCIVKNPKNY